MSLLVDEKKFNPELVSTLKDIYARERPYRDTPDIDAEEQAENVRNAIVASIKWGEGKMRWLYITTDEELLVIQEELTKYGLRLNKYLEGQAYFCEGPDFPSQKLDRVYLVDPRVR